MKRFYFLFTFLFCLTVSFQVRAQTTALFIESAKDLYVFIDGTERGYAENNDKVAIRDIEPGIHTIAFYKVSGNGYEEQVELEPGMAYIYENPFAAWTRKKPLKRMTQDDFVDIGPEDEESEVTEVFFIVEDMPRFNGYPIDSFRTYIAENLQYPKIAAENGISGKVYVQFTIHRTGKVVDAVVTRGVDPSLDAEALRVVRSSPRWVPGKQRGRPVHVVFTFPITFVLQ